MDRGVDTLQVVRKGSTKECLTILCGRINAIPAVESIVQQWSLVGRIMIMDAILTPRHPVQTIGAPGGDDVRIVTEYPPPLRADIALVGPRPPVGDCQATARPVAQERRRGRAVAAGALTNHRCAWATEAV